MKQPDDVFVDGESDIEVSLSDRTKNIETKSLPNQSSCDDESKSKENIKCIQVPSYFSS